MPFIPHTEDDITAMLQAIGAPSIDALFDEIPSALRSKGLKHVPEGLNEMAITRLMHERAALDQPMLNFIGAGAYEHHIPAAVWQIVTRGEYYSAYTPYQAEASQGTLQLLYEFQTMMASLTAMEVSNASMYDGASALAEAILMAVRAHKTSRKILLPRTLHPYYLEVVRSIVKSQAIDLIEFSYDAVNGTTPLSALENQTDFAALVISQPNFFGALEVIRAALPILRAQRGGHIVNISAAAAIANYPGFSIYGATKCALEGVSESLAAELKPFGIHVTIVQPGPFRTGFIGRSLARATTHIADYDSTSGKFRRLLEAVDGKQPGDPARAAEAIIAAVESAAPPLRLVLGKYATDKVRKKLAATESELSAWQSVGVATEFSPRQP